MKVKCIKMEALGQCAGAYILNVAIQKRKEKEKEKVGGTQS